MKLLIAGALVLVTTVAAAEAWSQAESVESILAANHAAALTVALPFGP